MIRAPRLLSLLAASSLTVGLATGCGVDRKDDAGSSVDVELPEGSEGSTQSPTDGPGVIPGSSDTEPGTDGGGQRTTTTEDDGGDVDPAPPRSAPSTSPGGLDVREMVIEMWMDMGASRDAAECIYDELGDLSTMDPTDADALDTLEDCGWSPAG